MLVSSSGTWFFQYFHYEFCSLVIFVRVWRPTSHGIPSLLLSIPYRLSLILNETDWKYQQNSILGQRSRNIWVVVLISSSRTKTLLGSAGISNMNDLSVLSSKDLQKSVLLLLMLGCILLLSYLFSAYGRFYHCIAKKKKISTIQFCFYLCCMAYPLTSLPSSCFLLETIVAASTSAYC